MSDILFLSNVRLSFNHIADPQRKTDEKTGETRVSHNCELLMPESDSGYVAFIAQFQKLLQTQYPDHYQQIAQMILADRKSRCFGKGDEKISKKTFKPYDGYAGNVYITAGNKAMPQIIRADGRPADNNMEAMQLARAMYDGCYVNAAIKPWVQKPNPTKQYGHGIRCDLIAVQFAKDGQPFGAEAPDASNLFGAVAAPAVPGFGVVAEAAPAMPLPPFMAR